MDEKKQLHSFTRFYSPVFIAVNIAEKPQVAFFIHFLFMEQDDKKLVADPPAAPIDEPGSGGPAATTSV